MKKHSKLPARLRYFAFCLLAITVPLQFMAQSAANFQNTAASKLLFLENKGQVTNTKGEARPDVLFVAKGQGCKVFVTARGLTYQFEQVEHPKGYDPSDRRMALQKPATGSTHRMDMRLIGANSNPSLHREKRSDYFENYHNVLHAPDGILGVAAYEQLRFEEVYPGIDWVLYSNAKGLKYDFILKSGADPAQIQMDYTYADHLQLNADGSLTITTALGTVTEAAPQCFQGEKSVAAHFVLEGNRISIALEAYDRSMPLVIDPDVIWATYYGGTDLDSGHCLTSDAAGNVYMSGIAYSSNAIADGGHQNMLIGHSDAFLVKFNTDGVRQFATYYGGGGGEGGQGIAIDQSGNIYMTGGTFSGFNIAFGGHQNTPGGEGDAFLVKFNAAGVRQWATYYGGSEHEEGLSTVVDAAGNIYMNGFTRSGNAIASGGHQNTFGGGTQDAFLVKFNTDGIRQWGTYYGGAFLDEVYFGLAIDANDNLYLAGHSNSSDNIAFEGHQNTLGGSADAFIVKFNSDGIRQWGTYYGGTGADMGWGITADANGNLYLAGETRSNNNIAFGGHQSIRGGDTDAFLAKFNAEGTLQWGTYYGGTGTDLGIYATVDVAGYVHLIGSTNSTTAIAFNGYQNTYNGGLRDAFFARFDANGIRQWGSYYGGDEDDIGDSGHVDVFGNLYMTGWTASLSNIASNGHQNTYGGGGHDAYLVKFCPTPTFTAVLSDTECPGTASGQIAFTDLNGASSYEYSINNGASWQTANTYADLAAGEYTLLVRNAAMTGCVSFAEVDTVFAGVDSTPPMALCQSATLTLNTDGTGTMLATAFDGGSFDDCSEVTLTLSESVFDCANLGTNSLTLTATDMSGNSSSCMASLTVMDPTNPAALAAPIELMLPAALCPNETGTASAFSEGASAYVWSNGSTGLEVGITAPGDYMLTVTKGCYEIDTTFVIAALDLPDLEIPQDALLCPGNSITLTAVTDVESIIEWSTGQISPQIQVESLGTYMATAINRCGSVSDSLTLQSAGCENCFYVPNAFSPNSDGVNDRFSIASLCPTEAYHLRIFSRWGELLFESKQLSEGWDGSFRGRVLLQGVYIWTLAYTQDGQTFEKSGALNLLR